MRKKESFIGLSDKAKREKENERGANFILSYER